MIVDQLKATINVLQFTDEIVKQNREKLMKERWFFKLTEGESDFENSFLKMFFKKVFDLEFPITSRAVAYTNVDTGGSRWHTIMYSSGPMSPNCQVFSFIDFLKFLTTISDLPFCGDDEKLKEVKKLQQELKNKIKEIDDQASSIKDKLVKNYKKQIDFILDTPKK